MRKKSKKKQIVAMTLALSVLSSSVGMCDGSLLFFRAAVKPTPSIAATQQTVNKDGKEIEISIKGRHDPIIVPRAVVVVEAMTAITILDALLSNMTARLDRIIDFYRQ